MHALKLALSVTDKKPSLNKVYLSNGRIITFAYLAGRIWIGGLVGKILVNKAWDSFFEFIKVAASLWQMSGVSIRSWTSCGASGNTWTGRFVSGEEFDCELVCSGVKTAYYGMSHEEEVTYRRWYVRLSRPVESIMGALISGLPTNELNDAVMHGLWKFGLRSPTPLEAYSPTGKVHTTLSIKVSGRRVIVENTHFLDV